MTEAVIISVPGQPLPKQSFRAANGGGYTEQRIKDWQNAVSKYAAVTMMDRDKLDGYLEVTIIFWRKDMTRVDCDNISKGLLDAMNGIVYSDDQQVIDLRISKRVSRKSPGCRIIVRRAKVQNICEGWLDE